MLACGGKKRLNVWTVKRFRFFRGGKGGLPIRKEGGGGKIHQIRIRIISFKGKKRINVISKEEAVVSARDIEIAKALSPDGRGQWTKVPENR